MDKKSGENETELSQEKSQSNGQSNDQTNGQTNDQSNGQTNDQTKNDKSKEDESKETAQPVQNRLDLQALLLDRSNECDMMIEISKHGLCQPVYAKYNNGE